MDVFLLSGKTPLFCLIGGKLMGKSNRKSNKGSKKPKGRQKNNSKHYKLTSTNEVKQILKRKQPGFSVDAMFGDVLNALDSEMYELAHELLASTVKSGESAIDAFYEDYDPEVYRRIYSLGSHGKPYIIETNGVEKTSTGYKVEVRFPASAMNGEHKAASPIRGEDIPNEIIFEQAFYEGFHGGVDGIAKFKDRIYEVTRMDVSPWELIQRDAAQAFNKLKNKIK